MPLLPDNLDILAVVGLVILVTFSVGQVARYLRMPQVVGFIIAGVLLGPALLGLIPAELSDSLTFVTELALGLIGFEMGEHLRFGELRHMGRCILIVVMFQALGAFLLVFSGVYLLTGSTPLALVLGAIGMATAPAATVDVLAEYGAEGPLTTTLMAVIGIDDAITLLAFSVAAAIAEPLLVSPDTTSLLEILSGSGSVSLAEMIELPVVEIGGSLLVGGLMGAFLTMVMNRIDVRHDPARRQHDAMAISIAMVFITTGLSRTMNLSLILTPMIMGIVVVNRNPRHARFIRFTIEQAGPVVYVLFFALVGASVRLDALPAMGLVGLAYMILRIMGKYGGAWLGGYVAGADPSVRDNLGLALLSQAGVAIGLALESGHRFGDLGASGEELAELVVSIVAATTFVVQLIGPLLVKVAIQRAGEIGRAHEVAIFE